MTAHALPRDDRRARALWSRVAEPGDPRLPWLLGLTDRPGGDAVETTREPDPVGGLQRLARTTDRRHQGLRDRLAVADVEADLGAGEACGARVVVPGDDEWPASLADLGVRAPVCLWVRGPVDLAPALSRSVSVVGSRAASDYGRHVTDELALGLAQRGFTIVSGAAFGVDAVAHRAALSVEAPTVAVLASGVDRPYPASHAGLIAEIARSGAVVTEMAPGSVPARHRFLQRNRLIAALTNGTVVVEAGLRSGALSTANRAVELCRPVGAVPGPVTSAGSAGCHELVRERGAVLVTDAAEVAELCGDYGRDLAPTRRAPEQTEDHLLPQDRLLLSALPYRTPVPLTQVAVTAGLSVAQARASWGRLQLEGLVEQVDGLARLGPAARAARRGRGARPVAGGETDTR